MADLCRNTTSTRNPVSGRSSVVRTTTPRVAQCGDPLLTESGEQLLTETDELLLTEN